jgi:regulator of sigma E protease
MSGLIFLVVLCVVILVHEFGHFIAARRCGVKVEVFSLGFGPKIIKKKVKDTELCLCLIPFGGYVKLAGDNREEFKGRPWEYFSQSIFKRAKIIFFGSFLNYISAFLFLWLVFFLGYPQLSTKVGEVMKGYPAEDAGIMIDDEIIKVNDTDTKMWPELQEAIASKKGTNITLTVKRSEKLVNINIVPRKEELENQLGEKKEIGIIGVRPKGEVIFMRYNIAKASVLGLEKLLYLTAMTYKSIFYMIVGKISTKEAITGPIGIFHITQDAARYGIIAVIHLMAIISMSLAVVNLLPFPVLDGGHIFLLLLEKIRGKPLNNKLEENINQVGLYILFTIFVLIIINDFGRYGYWEKIAKIFFKEMN